LVITCSMHSADAPFSFSRRLSSRDDRARNASRLSARSYVATTSPASRSWAARASSITTPIFVLVSVSASTLTTANSRPSTSTM
jgi:hypothetical protein